MADVPDELTLTRNRDMAGRGRYRWLRYLGLALVGAVLVLALLNVFGQRPRNAKAAGAAATLEVLAPTRMRSGLIYTARFRVRALQELKDATLVLDSGWASGMTFNGTAPQPLSSGNRNGKAVFTFGHVPAGETLRFYVSLQVNPTTIGRRRQNVELDDGDTRIAIVKRTMTIFP